MKLSAGILLLAMVAASPEVRYFRYERPVSVPESVAGQACLVIDPEIFPHAAQGLTDLRLYKGSAETPFVLDVAETSDAFASEVALLNLGIRGGSVVFDAEMPDHRYSDLYMNVDAKDYIATVSVAGSEEKEFAKATELGKYTIFDLSGQKLGSSTVLHLPDSNYRYLHFRIDGPLKPKAMHGFHVGWQPVRPTKFVTVAETMKLEQKGRTSVAELTVPAHVDVDRVTFVVGVAPASFSRSISVRGEWPERPPRSDESPVSSTVTEAGTIRRIHREEQGRHIDIEDLSTETRLAGRDDPARWTVTVENGDDRPLAIESVRLEMLEHRMCFEAETGGQYKLMYGDPRLTYPKYDYAALFVEQNKTIDAKAGPEALNPAFQPRPDDRPFTERHPVLLWVALGAVIALLGAIALKTAKRGVGGGEKE